LYELTGGHARAAALSDRFLTLVRDAPYSAAMSPVNESEVRKLVREAVDRALGPASAGPESPKPGPSARPAAATAPEARRAPVPADHRVAIGSDHGGFELKEILRRVIRDEMGWEVVDCGTHSTEAVDYPDYAAAVGREVASGRCARGIVIDAAGIGSTMAANKVSGVRCALCHDDATAPTPREHNDANVLALGAKVVNRGWRPAWCGCSSPRRSAVDVTPAASRRSWRWRPVAECALRAAPSSDCRRPTSTAISTAACAPARCSSWPTRRASSCRPASCRISSGCSRPAKRTRNLGDYLKIFDVTLSVMQQRDALYRVAYELAEDAAKENIRHLEVRYAPDPSQEEEAEVRRDRRRGDRGTARCGRPARHEHRRHHLRDPLDGSQNFGRARRAGGRVQGARGARVRSRRPGEGTIRQRRIARRSR
jgi:ribose 5-phosphate isomerase B